MTVKLSDVDCYYKGPYLSYPNRYTLALTTEQLLKSWDWIDFTGDEWGDLKDNDDPQPELTEGIKELEEKYKESGLKVFFEVYCRTDTNGNIIDSDCNSYAWGFPAGATINPTTYHNIMVDLTQHFGNITKELSTTIYKEYSVIAVTVH